MTDRGWGDSCGARDAHRPALRRHKGYIRLMHNAYEVRDAQYALGQLADDGVIDPQRIGATGGSYGGGMSIALGALRNRTQLPDGSARPVDEPARQADERSPRPCPEFTWSRHRLRADTRTARTLDYVADARLPRRRPPRRRPEAELEQLALPRRRWLLRLLRARSARDPSADIIGLEGADGHRRPVRRQPRGGGDGRRAHRQPLRATTSTTASPPAPALLANGWNDDLFPVDESLRYYNKVRAKYPDAPISMFHLDFGHSPRARRDLRRRPRRADRGRERLAGLLRQGRRAEPADARGGVDILTSKCPVNGAGTRYHAPTWALLAPGEIRVDGAAPQTIVAPGTRAEQRVHLRRRLHDDRRAPTTRRAATYKVPAGDDAPTRSRARRRSSPSSTSRAPTTWSPRGCTTSTAPPSG